MSYHVVSFHVMSFCGVDGVCHVVNSVLHSAGGILVLVLLYEVTFNAFLSCGELWCVMLFLFVNLHRLFLAFLPLFLSTSITLLLLTSCSFFFSSPCDI